MKAQFTMDCPKSIADYIAGTLAVCSENLSKGLIEFQVRMKFDGLEGVLEVNDNKVVDSFSKKTYAVLTGNAVNRAEREQFVREAACNRCGASGRMVVLHEEADEDGAFVIQCGACRKEYTVEMAFRRGQMFCWEGDNSDGTHHSVAWNVTALIGSLHALGVRVQHISPELVQLFVRLNDSCQNLDPSVVAAVDTSKPVIAVAHPAFTDDDVCRIEGRAETLLVIDGWHRMRQAADKKHGLTAIVVSREDEQRFRVTTA